MKVLIADDDPGIRRGLAAQIEADGFETVVCSNGDEALAILSGDEPPPIAVLDWIMPKLSGPDVCAAVRGTEQGLTAYIIILTARIDPRDVVAALDKGADDYVTKPFSLPELRARVRVGRRVTKLQHELKAQLDRVQEVAQEANQLRRLLPVCVDCQRICNDEAYWQAVRHYLRSHQDLHLGGSICSDCAAKQRDVIEPGEQTS